ncbi:hypothetical protein DPMN_075189 [Dreissena polymorpha]|uniref:Uncharacterized protein n=1 Tax=Dreissena polymorpha TaxID=45954 RepID=A0A9D4BM99_DREPO|nr:hypothetical protein DPMN_075189 [Dreissena polymorpha]
MINQDVTVPNLSGIGGLKCGGLVTSVGRAIALYARCPGFESRTGCTLFTTQRQWRPTGDRGACICMQFSIEPARGFVRFSYTLFPVTQIGGQTPTWQGRMSRYRT